MDTQLDIKEILTQMLTAAEGSLKDKWPDIKDIATSSFKTLAQNVIDIERMLKEGTISDEQAHFKFQIQKNALKAMLLTEEGLGLLAVEAAINAALAIVKDAVNKTIGLVLI